MPKEEEKELKKKEEKKKSWWANLPTNLKIIGIAFAGLILYQAQQTGKPIQWQWIVLAGIILWLQGREKEEVEVMNETLARKLTKQKIKELRRYGDIPKGTDFWVSKNVGLKHSKGVPSFYLMGMLFRYPNGRYEFGQAQVDCKTWDVRPQESIGKLTGREPVIEKPIIPDFLKYGKMYPDLMKSDVLRFLGR